MEERLAGGEDTSPYLLFDGAEGDEGPAGELMVYWRTDSGEALLRLLSDFGGRAGEAPREELFDDAPGLPYLQEQQEKLEHPSTLCV